MAELIVVYWRDIPAQVIVKAGRKSAKRELSKRFIEAIDRVAMREEVAATGDYLEQWRRGDPVPCGDDLEAEADCAMQLIEAEFPADRLRSLGHTGAPQP